MTDAGEPRKYATKARGRPFARGNPGKPPGARHKTTLAVESLLDGEAEKLTRKAIKLALAGDSTALKQCMDRISPPRKGRAAPFPLPAIVTAAMSGGRISPAEAVEIAAVIETTRRAIETQDVEVRLHALEERFK
jgi:hypothetical protein